MSAFRLTAKQQSYADNRIKGMGQLEALENSLYDTSNMTGASKRNMAWKLENHANIMATIEMALNEVHEQVIQMSGFDKAKALEWATEDRELARQLRQAGAAVSASRLACDLAGLIVDKKQVDIRNVADMSEDDIAEQLAQLRAERDRLRQAH